MDLVGPVGEADDAGIGPQLRQSEIVADAAAASSTIRCAILGAAILIIAISARAALLPTVSIIWAALRQSRRAISISQRARAIRSSHTECSAIALPNARRASRRRHIFSSATSIVAMLRIV